MLPAARTFVVVLSLIAFRVGSNVGERTRPGPAANDTVNVQVMSFNILNSEKSVAGVTDWNSRRQIVANLIKDNSEIAGLQEVLSDQKQDLQKLLGAQWGHIGVGRDDGDEAGEFCLIFYSRKRFEVDEHGTFWFSDRPDVVASIPGEEWGSPKQRRICTWGRFIEKGTGRGFYLYNVHLTHRRGAAQPLLYRTRSVVLLQERVSSRNYVDDPFVITGDFNAPPGDDSIELMVGSAYTPEESIFSSDWQRAIKPSLAVEPLIHCWDTWAFLYPEQAEQRTFHGGRGEQGRGWRLDYIFVPLSVSIVSADVLRFSESGFFPSDHYPITASLSLFYQE